MTPTLRLISKARIMITAILLCAACNAGAVVPVVRSFTRAVYGGGAQNWAIAQDSLGRMYFGNRYGLISYDSRSWEIMRIPNFSTIRSILIDDDKERIYVGASEDFGYFQVEPMTGKRIYHSLRQTIEGPAVNFSEIWNIHRDKRTFWFQSDFHIFRFNGTTSVTIPFNDKITSSAFINGRLYVALLNKGLVTVNDRAATPVDGSEELNGKRIVSILPGPGGSVMVVTDFHGIYEIKGGVTTQPEWTISRFLRENQAFSATYCPSTRQYAFGTVNAGAVIVENGADPSPIYINVAAGMQNNTVLNLRFDREANLWLALDNGIDYAVTNSPIHPLPFSGAVYGAGYTSLLSGSQLLLGTNRGLYSFPYPYPATANTTEHSPMIKGQIWSMDTIGSSILVSGDAGLFAATGPQAFRKIENVSGCWCVKPIPGKPGLAIASTYDGFVIVERTPSGWQLKNRVAGRKDASGQFTIDRNGDIWLAHWMRGIYRLRLNSALNAFVREDLYNSGHGLPTDRNNLVSTVNGRLVFSTEGGFCRFDEKKQRFVPDSAFNHMFRARNSARLYQSDGNEIWSVSPDYVWRSTLSPAGTHELDSTTYQPLGAKLIPGFDHLEFLTSHRALMASQDGFYEINVDYRDPSPVNPGIFVSQIYANQDSLIYTAPLAPTEEILKVPYSLNSLRFEFVTPEYRAHNALRYSFCLEGYDNDWSSWARATSKEYTHLSEGTYTLRVRSFDAYTGQTAETAFTFTVAPPWYRSILARIIYLLLVIGAIYGGYMLVRRNSRRVALRVERRKEEEMEQMKRDANEEALRKDYEIAHLKSQQLEHDIKHKSEELSNITMNVIRKNEILLDIAGKLTKLQESLPDDSAGTAASKQLYKIQKLIQDNISHDDDWRSFTQNFDVVYENYTKRLTALHPELNASDQRICCYLKMGLSSKEIAPLFNISYRSVEMTRYRLRKKMGLSRDINLAEYLQKI